MHQDHPNILKYYDIYEWISPDSQLKYDKRFIAIKMECVPSTLSNEIYKKQEAGIKFTDIEIFFFL